MPIDTVLEPEDCSLPSVWRDDQFEGGLLCNSENLIKNYNRVITAFLNTEARAKILFAVHSAPIWLQRHISLCELENVKINGLKTAKREDNNLFGNSVYCYPAGDFSKGLDRRSLRDMTTVWFKSKCQYGVCVAGPAIDTEEIYNIGNVAYPMDIPQQDLLWEPPVVKQLSLDERLNFVGVTRAYLKKWCRSLEGGNDFNQMVEGAIRAAISSSLFDIDE